MGGEQVEIDRRPRGHAPARFQTATSSTALRLQSAAIAVSVSIRCILPWEDVRHSTAPIGELHRAARLVRVSDGAALCLGDGASGVNPMRRR